MHLKFLFFATGFSSMLTCLNFLNAANVSRSYKRHCASRIDEACAGTISMHVAKQHAHPNCTNTFKMVPEAPSHAVCVQHSVTPLDALSCYLSVSTCPAREFALHVLCSVSVLQVLE